MSTTFPIYAIAKDLNIESSRIISACKTLGINAKGSTKKLKKQELEKIKSYFETGKNVSQEIIEINENNSKETSKLKNSKENTKVDYFVNRLIRKS